MVGIVESEENFDWWITCLPDMVLRLKDIIPGQVSAKLDGLIGSLTVLGEYLCDNFEGVEWFLKENELWDSCAGYVGVTYQQIVSTATWVIELDDKDDAYFKIPCLVTEGNTHFYPHFEITAMVDRKRSDFLHALVSKHREINLKQ